MKYTINGFDQKLFFEYGLNLTDSFLVRWFVDFSATSKMSKIQHNGETFLWVKYSAVIEEFPCLEIKTADGVSNRFKKFVECGLMSNHTEKNKMGTFSCFKLNDDKYLPLISSTHIGIIPDGSADTCHPVRSGLATPSGLDLPTKDPSTNNPLTNKSKSLAGPRPAVKRVKSPEQIAKDTETTNQLADLLEFCKSENYTVNPDRKFTGIMIAALKREGPDRVKKAIRNYLADVKTNGKFAGSFETLFYNPGRMAKYANMKNENKLESWEDFYANKNKV